MLETLIAVGLLMLLAGAGYAAALVPWDALIMTGAALVLAGLGFGLPCAFWYHVLLRRALAALGPVPAGWVWSPMEQHARVPEARRRAVLVWFGLGVAGWSLALLGCVVVAIAVLRGSD